MKNIPGYKSIPFTFNRRAVAAASGVNRSKNTIHAITESDITEVLRKMREHKEKTGDSLSLTAYVVICLAKAVAENPNMNSFRKGRRLILLDDVTISVLIEREIDEEKVPEPLAICRAQAKSFGQIHDEIRLAQKTKNNRLGSLNGSAWIRFIPGFLLGLFIRIADKNITMAKRYGKVAVTAVGMFSKESVWFIPLSSATVLVTVGGINKKVALIDGRVEEREHLCMTLSFNHDIIDGAPAVRFIKRFTELIKSGPALKETAQL